MTNDAGTWPSALYSEAVKVVMCWDAASTATKNTRAVCHHLLDEAITRLRDAVQATRMEQQAEPEAAAPNASREEWRNWKRDIRQSLRAARALVDSAPAPTPAPPSDRGLRPSVLWFAQEMERKLREHDDRGGWSECAAPWLLGRLRQETQELNRAIGGEGNITDEAADVANFAMMIADNAGPRLDDSQVTAEACRAPLDAPPSDRGRDVTERYVRFANDAAERLRKSSAGLRAVLAKEAGDHMEHVNLLAETQDAAARVLADVTPLVTKVETLTTGHVTAPAQVDAEEDERDLSTVQEVGSNPSAGVISLHPGAHWLTPLAACKLRDALSLALNDYANGHCSLWDVDAAHAKNLRELPGSCWIDRASDVVPQCSSCGEPSPRGHLCGDCAKSNCKDSNAVRALCEAVEKWRKLSKVDDVQRLLWRRTQDEPVMRAALALADAMIDQEMENHPDAPAMAGPVVLKRGGEELAAVAIGGPDIAQGLAEALDAWKIDAGVTSQHSVDQVLNDITPTSEEILIRRLFALVARGPA